MAKKETKDNKNSRNVLFRTPNIQKPPKKKKIVQNRKRAPPTPKTTYNQNKTKTSKKQNHQKIGSNTPKEEIAHQIARDKTQGKEQKKKVFKKNGDGLAGWGGGRKTFTSGQSSPLGFWGLRFF